MNKRIPLLILLFVSLLPSQLQAYTIEYAMNKLVWYLLDYPSRLEKRRNMPETSQEYLKRVEAGLEHLDKHLEKTIKDDYDWAVTGPMMKDLEWEIQAKWKQGWWDHNPGLGDLILVSSVVTVLGIIIAACSHNSHNDAVNAPLADNDLGDLPPPPPYQGRGHRLGDA